MNSEQIRLLTKMKKLISNGKCRFANRHDRDYLNDLLEIGITPEVAWNVIMNLNYHFYFVDEKPNYSRGNDSLTFKREVNGVLAYIKLKVEMNNDNEEVVCLSFHKDNSKGR